MPRKVYLELLLNDFIRFLNFSEESSELVVSWKKLSILRDKSSTIILKKVFGLGIILGNNISILWIKPNFFSVFVFFIGCIRTFICKNKTNQILICAHIFWKPSERENLMVNFWIQRTNPVRHQYICWPVLSFLQYRTKKPRKFNT